MGGPFGTGSWLRRLAPVALCLAGIGLHGAEADDVRWLNRVTYGITAGSAERLRALGRKRFLDEQLRPAAEPAAEAEPLAVILARVEAEHRRIQAIADEDARQQARQAFNQQANQAAADAARRHLLQALVSPAQVREQMVWFWLNHFSVFQGKGDLKWAVADYEARAIRPHALGRFRDLLRATLTHPAMLLYLDNAQSAGGRINENYARELLELHTLGVDGGYTQSDVQELARVLTGVGVNPGPDRKLKPAWQELYLHEGAFEFNPARHDFGAKTVLGLTLDGQGFQEVERVLDLLAGHPATARFISRKLALYWLGQAPPPALEAAMVRTFQRSGGDLAEVLRVLFAAPAFGDSLGRAFRDPNHYVLAALRLAYDGKPPCNLKPVARWLEELGEPLFGHVTPDGYPPAAQAWSSPGQMAKRFEVARAIGAGNAGLFEIDGGRPGPVIGFPQLASRLFFSIIEPGLSAGTRQALDRAGTQQEWNTFLLASPEFMAR